MSQDFLKYELIVQDALRGVVREVLTRVSREGMPGDHHFYITFRTRHPGVNIPQRLRETYPDEMTIVLQHQFFGLELKEDAFEVTLSFNRSLERLRVPFQAVSAFVDPSVNFGLQFQTGEAGEMPGAIADPADPPAAEATSGADAAEPAADAPPAEKVVSLDAFRKK